MALHFVFFVSVMVKDIFLMQKQKGTMVNEQKGGVIAANSDLINVINYFILSR